jgi:hypothetical protein
MRVVREQMLCMISPNWSGDVASLSDPMVHQCLRSLFEDTGIVHFASLALLPNRPDDGQHNVKPSLLLELTVDEGIVPSQVLAALTSNFSQVLWNIYKNYCTDLNLPTESEKNAWLLNHLQQGLSVADGAYLGPRDHNVLQVLQERQLYKSAQKYAQSLPLWDRQDRSTFALKMVRWAEQISSFDWAREPAPRSFWRTKASAGKIGYFVKLITLGFVLLWILQGIFKFLKWCLAFLTLQGSEKNDALLRTIDSFFDSAIQLFSSAIHIGFRSVLVLLIAAITFVLFFQLLPALLPPWRSWLNAVVKEIDRPSQTWSSVVTYALAWLALLGLVSVLLFCFIFIFFQIQMVQSFYFWLFLSQQKWLWISVSVYFALFGVLAFILTFGMRSKDTTTGANYIFVGLRAKFQRWFQQPFDDETPRAQQVHESIEACEASLVGHTAHMLSLTDLRAPYWLSFAMTKIALRVVTYLGYTHFTESRLSGAPGIQYSHWHLIDGGRRLLFCANFDGTFGGYLDDFIKGPSIGVNMFWRWTQLRQRPSAIEGQPAVSKVRSFPPTRLGFFRGVKCELKFKAYARESMLPHLFRYEAINLSSEQKNRATTFRNALFGERTDANDDVIMRVLET